MTVTEIQLEIRKLYILLFYYTLICHSAHVEYKSGVDVTDVTIFAPAVGGMIHVSHAGPGGLLMKLYHA